MHVGIRENNQYPGELDYPIWKLQPRMENWPYSDFRPTFHAVTFLSSLENILILNSCLKLIIYLSNGKEVTLAKDIFHPAPLPAFNKYWLLSCGGKIWEPEKGKMWKKKEERGKLQRTVQ